MESNSAERSILEYNTNTTDTFIRCLSTSTSEHYDNQKGRGVLRRRRYSLSRKQRFDPLSSNCKRCVLCSRNDVSSIQQGTLRLMCVLQDYSIIRGLNKHNKIERVTVRSGTTVGEISNDDDMVYVRLPDKSLVYLPKNIVAPLQDTSTTRQRKIDQLLNGLPRTGKLHQNTTETVTENPNGLGSSPKMYDIQRQLISKEESLRERTIACSPTSRSVCLQCKRHVISLSNPSPCNQCKRRPIHFPYAPVLEEFVAIADDVSVDYPLANCCDNLSGRLVPRGKENLYPTANVFEDDSEQDSGVYSCVEGPKTSLQNLIKQSGNGTISQVHEFLFQYFLKTLK